MDFQERPLAFYYSWQDVPDAMIPNIMAEFSWNGVENLVFSHSWITRILSEPQLSSILTRHARAQHVNLIEVHAPWGQAFDLCCPDRGRRATLIADHKRAMAYCADSGCKTYTVHIGAYESVFYHTPNAVLRPFAVDTLEQLLPTAEQLNLVIAVENSYERSNTPDEVLYYVNHFNSPWIQCCFDAGHAHLMAPAPGKERAKYFEEMDWAWGDKIEEYSDALEHLAPHIATCHLHDNDGYSDAHLLPGRGTIDWKSLIGKLKKCPRLLSMQTEVTTSGGLSIGQLVRTFRELMDRV